MFQLKFYIEGYGCSLNTSDTEQIKAALEKAGQTLTQKPEEADKIILNACAVKEPTELKMLTRIKKLSNLKKQNAELIVFGCLTKISPEKVKQANPNATQIPPSLENLLTYLFQVKTNEFSPKNPSKPENKLVSIIPIARGCTGTCTYCAVKNARGELKSYPEKELEKRFKKDIKNFSEIWLTAQDTGAYGKDIKSSLVKLLKKLLRYEGTYKIRIGMMNPAYAKKQLNGLIPILKNKKTYKFLHIPVQSGSNKILKAMNRNYTSEQYSELIKKLRTKIPNLTISTDVIAGFPGETETEFKKTLVLLKQTKPDIVNISRYGNRPNTKAEKMPNQVHTWIRKARTRKLTELCKTLSLERNQLLLNTEQEIFINEKGTNNTMVGRTQNYKPVAVKNAESGQTLKVLITEAKPTHLLGTPINKS